jgi:molybdate-binding protein/DNA-binding XRE family transcriptional regulator
MATSEQRRNNVKTRRVGRGWSQAELARRAGVSRAAVSAIEVRRLVPSVAAALALATALGCSVEELFGAPPGAPAWAWTPPDGPCRYWHARVGGRTLLYPVEPTAAGVVRHDGVYRDGSFLPNGGDTPEATVVLATCDPAAALLAGEVARAHGFRLLLLSRSSQQAFALLGQGLVHLAGVHLAAAGESDGNARAVRAALGGGYRLLRTARWEEGLAVGPGVGVRSVKEAVRAKLRWVGRELGSAARQCLDELRADRQPPRLLARDHRGVAEAVRCGWAEVGVCLSLVSQEAGLEFLSVRLEDYDLCYPAAGEDDPRIRAVISVVRSATYRQVIGTLPGYDASDAGEIQNA